ncbi:MAG: hypothetical protein AAFR50_07460, partial [Pseudomonadota bacterium]
LTNEDGGLLTAEFESFFARLPALMPPELSIVDISRAFAFQGLFSPEVTRHAEMLMREDHAQGGVSSFSGAMSEKTALTLLRTGSLLDDELACWRLAGLRAEAALPELEALARQSPPHGQASQHITAAQRAIAVIKG